MIKRVENIMSIGSQGLEYYSTLRRPLEHYEKGIFVIEGDKVVKRFFESQLELVSVLLTEGMFEAYRESIEKRNEAVIVYIAKKELLMHIVGFKYHQGIMAVGRVPQLLSVKNLMDLSTEPLLIVALDRLESAENTGVLVRNCAACGVNGLLVGETSADPYLRRAVRNSMGTVFRVPVIKCQSLKESLLYLRQKYKFQVLAAHPRIDSVALNKSDLTKNTVLVFGNEGEGISQSIIDVSDYSITIPMSSGIDSFNVACASAIMLYEANRQRELLFQK